MKPKLCGVYCITNTVTHQKYIGQSRNIRKRWGFHITELNGKRHSNRLLQISYDTHGRQNFEFSILELGQDIDLDAREIYWIAQEDTTQRGFNRTAGGMRGAMHSPETRALISERVRAAWTKRPRIRPPPSEETRQKLRLSHRNNPRVLAQLKIINARKIGHPLAESTKQKISAATRGKRLSETAIERIRVAYKQRAFDAFKKKPKSTQAKGIETT